VATFDHHCPWIGNCIGEKNRNIFFIFICTFLAFSITTHWIFVHFGNVSVSQMVNAILVPIFRKPSTDTAITMRTVLSSGISVILCAIIIGLLYLVVLNLILMVKNLTTWELFAWSNISYMRLYSKGWQSPFDQGLKGNLKDYWSSNGKEIRTWKVANQSQNIIK
jgi:palmitoyltransferase